MKRQRGIMLFSTEQIADPFNWRPIGTKIVEAKITNAREFTNIGTATSMQAGVPVGLRTEKIAINATQFRGEAKHRYVLYRDMNNEWTLARILKPEDFVPRNPNLIRLVLIEHNDADTLNLAVQYYEEQVEVSNEPK